MEFIEPRLFISTNHSQYLFLLNHRLLLNFRIKILDGSSSHHWLLPKQYKTKIKLEQVLRNPSQYYFRRLPSLQQLTYN